MEKSVQGGAAAKKGSTMPSSPDTILSGNPALILSGLLAAIFASVAIALNTLPKPGTARWPALSLLVLAAVAAAGALGAVAVGNRQATFAAFVKSESLRWGAIIREKGIKPE